MLRSGEDHMKVVFVPAEHEEPEALQNDQDKEDTE